MSMEERAEKLAGLIAPDRVFSDLFKEGAVPSNPLSTDNAGQLTDITWTTNRPELGGTHYMSATDALASGSAIKGDLTEYRENLAKS